MLPTDFGIVLCFAAGFPSSPCSICVCILCSVESRLSVSIRLSFMLLTPAESRRPLCGLNLVFLDFLAPTGGVGVTTPSFWASVFEPVSAYSKSKDCYTMYKKARPDNQELSAHCMDNYYLTKLTNRQVDYSKLPIVKFIPIYTNISIRLWFPSLWCL